MPKLYHTFADEENLYVVLEFISNGTLAEKISHCQGQGYTKDLVQFYAAQIVLALEFF